MNLHDYLVRAQRGQADAIAVEETSGARITYAGLADLAARLRHRLIAMDVAPGDRVGLYLHKSIDAVAAVFGILEAAAAYVPIEPTAPTGRNARILLDASVKVLIVEAAFEDAVRQALSGAEAPPQLIVLDRVGGGSGLEAALSAVSAPPAASRTVPPSSLAYLLYTSGSTGDPKGVMLSHENGCQFVEWCLKAFGAASGDRLSSHAALSFDLSIHDVFVSIASGATLVLLSEEVARDAPRLAQCIAEKRITIWYSVPFVLQLLVQFGNLKRHDYSALRTVLFAGEIFPLEPLRALCAEWPKARYYNLYGPTETNVCTRHEVSAADLERVSPLPIGRLCDHLRCLVVDEDGREVANGREGELCVSGPNVMLGYWKQPEQTERAFLRAIDRYYRTGDRVVLGADGVLLYLGRRDRMVKKRGFRVELGEIEACLHRHPRVREVAVVARNDAANGILIVAKLSLRGSEPISSIALRRFCSEQLPVYMIPDRFELCSALPRTPTAKVDYEELMSAS